MSDACWIRLLSKGSHFILDGFSLANHLRSLDWISSGDYKGSAQSNLRFSSWVDAHSKLVSRSLITFLAMLREFYMPNKPSMRSNWIFLNFWCCWYCCYGCRVLPVKACLFDWFPLKRKHDNEIKLEFSTREI